MKLTDPSRDIWLWLFHDGGAWTAAELAGHLEADADDVFWRLSGMARRGLVDKLDPRPGCRRLRYAVSGTCLVPNGMCVAEVQTMDDTQATFQPVRTFSAESLSRLQGFAA